MDVDLSTDLRALLPLVAPLLSGHSDVAIGTRLASGARVVRGPKRELISRSYNVILRTALRARFSDAQCGFKAVRREALPGLLDAVRDNGWFFDTELLVLAQRRGLRIHEVPVDWVDDPDSRVAIVKTAVDDLRGVARLMASGPVARFMGVGVLSTLAYALLFLLLRSPLGAAGANAFALAITAVGNTAANRRLTFGVRGRAGLLRQHLMGALVFVLTLGLTSGALTVLHGLDATPARPVELGVLIAASAAATISRYVALKSWVFARRAEVEPPVVTAHRVPRRELELLRAEQREAELRADRVGRRVLDVRERVDGPVATGLARRFDGEPSRRRGHAPALRGGQHRPADLVDLLAPPLAVPVADPAEVLTVGDDLQAAGVGLVALLPRGDLLLRLGPAEVLHHRRVADQRLQQRQVAGAPALQPDAHGRSRPKRNERKTLRAAFTSAFCPPPSARGGLLWRKRSSTPSRSPSSGTTRMSMPLVTSRDS